VRGGERGEGDGVTDARPAPYPADTRAKGWRFELEYERIEQSDTWAIAEEVPMAQHALLFMWLAAWKQEPCGSFPNDEAVIRSKCRVPPKLWAGLRDVLLRGWWLAEDGRLYHPTITARVLEMLEYRKKTAERVAKHKAAMREQRAGNTLPTGESCDRNDTGTGTGTNLKQEDTHTPLASEWVLPKAWGEWAIAEYPHWTPEAVRSIAEQFADHQWSKAATSADWSATWRKWCRDDLTQRAHPVPKPKPADKPQPGAPAITVPSTDKGAERFNAAMDERKSTATKPPSHLLALARKTVRTA
jgi:hypothetical protein